MVIVIEQFGNHCNRLFQTTHIEAFCLEAKVPFINLTLNDMAPVYRYFGIPFGKFLSRLVRKLESLGLIKVLELIDFQKQTEYEIAMKKAGLVFVRGWCFRRSDLTDKYGSYFRNKFGLKDKFKVEELVTRTELARSLGLALVGVHIRRGDYVDWNEGKYFYSDTVYERYMSMTKKLVSDHLGIADDKIRFLVFSNDGTEILGSSTIWISQSQWYIDLYLMSLCHFIIGPPSTFSLWASYIGGSKVFHITDPDAAVLISDFVVCT